MAVGHAQQLVSSGLHSATKCHVTCVCTLNTMHENIRTDREVLSTSRCKVNSLEFWGDILILIPVQMNVSACERDIFKLNNNNSIRTVYYWNIYYIVIIIIKLFILYILTKYINFKTILHR